MICPKCGSKTLVENSVFCNQCGYSFMDGKAATNKWYENKAVVLLLIFLFYPAGFYLLWKMNPKKSVRAVIALAVIFTTLFWLSIIGFIGSELDASTTFDNSINTSVAEEETPDAESAKKEYVAACKTYSYKEILRNPANYEGEKAYFQGKVIQAQESGGKTVLRVNVTKGKNNAWTDTIYVEYTKKDENESRILKDDIIKIYGELDGIKNITASGQKTNVPKIAAEYIDIVE